MRSQDGEGGTFTSVKLGGGQIEFEDEDPQIHKDFEAAMRKAGARCNMRPGRTGNALKMAEKLGLDLAGAKAADQTFSRHRWQVEVDFARDEIPGS